MQAKNIIAREDRRRQIAQLLQQNNTETEIARQLGVDLSTISRDVKVLKQQATQFVYNLAKQDLAFFYQQTIADIDHVRGECWKLYHVDSSNDDDSTSFFGNGKGSRNKKITTKDRLQALRTILQADIARYELLSQGEVIMSVKGIQEQLNILLEKQQQT